MALVFSACVLLVFDLLRQMVPRGWACAGAISVIALKPLGFPLWTIVNYSQFAMLFSLLALCALFRFLPERRLGWLAVAGLAVGATLVTKQNLGLLIGAVCALGITGDWMRDRTAGLALLACSSAVLLGGVLIPVMAFILLYAVEGSLGAFVQHAILGLGTLVGAYWIPLAPLHLWWWGTEDLGSLAFSYYPAPLTQLVLQGRLSLGTAPLVAIAGVFVDAAYYLPLVCLATAGLWLIQGLRNAEPRVSWSRWLVITAFAGLGYLSMLYRADWAHLMNVYPAQLVLLTAVAARGVARFPRLRRPVLGVGMAWLGAALAMTVATLIGTDGVVDSALGRLRGAPDRVETTKRVLSHLASRPAEEGIALLPDLPLYYPLSARHNPLAYDLLLPGIVRDDDDRRAAAQLAAVDRVIYNPKPVPSVWSQLPDFAPRTAAALARDFEVEEILSDSAYVFTRRAHPPHASRLVADLWERFDPQRIEMGAGRSHTLDRQPAIEQTSWMMYRVISTPLDGGVASACFSIPHPVGQREWLAVTPVFDPRTWPRNYSRIWYPETSPGLFEIGVRAEDGAPLRLWSKRLSPGAPESSLLLSLEAFSGQTVALRFCTRAVGRTHSGEIRVPAGWAEPRILAPPES
jgi:hypothetical protein